MGKRNWCSALRFVFLAWAFGVAGLAPAIAQGQLPAGQLTSAPAVAAPIKVEHGPNTAEQQANDNGAMDLFPKYTGTATSGTISLMTATGVILRSRLSGRRIKR